MLVGINMLIQTKGISSMKKLESSTLLEGPNQTESQAIKEKG